MAHLGHGTLFNLDLYRHPVPRKFLNLRLDAGPVAALGNILARQLELDPLEGGALENFPLSKPRARESLQQRIAFDRFITVEGDGVDGRALQKREHQHVPIPPNADIAEVARGKQGAKGLSRQIFVVAVPDIHREQAKHRSRRDPLQPLHPDIANGERRGAAGLLRHGPQGRKTKHQRKKRRTRDGEKGKFH